MKVRKAIKKMVALGSGLTMVGATLFGAAAADLGEYPSPLFIKDGRFDGIIVVGDDAAASDVIGSIDVATALQAESVVEEALAPGAGLYQGGAAPSVSFTGDVAEIGQPNDLLEMHEEIGDVRSILTSNDLNALRGGVVTTDEGTTDYNQYLRLKETSAQIDFVSTFAVTYDKDEDDNVGDFLFANDTADKFMFELHLQFEEGAESEIVSTSDGMSLPDLEDEIFSIMGTPFAVADVDITTNPPEVTLTLMGGAIADIMEEGETKEYVIDGVPYEVNVLIVSDTSNVVKFKINGEITDALKDGDADVLKDGTRVGIREILPNEAEEVTGGDLVEFYLGATEVKLTGDFHASNFTNSNSSVEINDELIEDAALFIRGRLYNSNKKMELLDVKYRLEADSLVGDLFIPPGHGLREYLAEPEGMMSPNWDIVYGGLLDVRTSILKFDSAGDDEYDIAFTNQEGLNYRFQFIDVSDQEGFKIGEKKHNLVWIEMDNSVDYRIAKDDVFILVDDVDDTGYTHVVKYESYDGNNRQLTFTDLYGETREFTTQEVLGSNQTDIIFGGNSFKVYVGPGTANNLSIDLNNDGYIGDSSSGGTERDSQDSFFMNTNCGVIAQTSNYIGFSINATGGVLSASTAVANSSANGVGPCRSAIVVQGGGILDLGICDGPRRFGTSLCNATAVDGTRDSGHYNVSTGTPGLFGVGLKTLNSEFDEDGPQDKAGDEVVSIRFENRTDTKVGLNLDKTGSRMPLVLNELKENDDITRGMTDYGVLLELYDPSDEAEDLTVEYPSLQRGAHVFVVAGEYSLEKKTGGVAQRIQKIKVGAAKLASEVADVTAFNAIVVGGPCANAAAAALLGNPADCTAGFAPGKAVIKLFENRGKVAVLVAGYDALDTRRAARVLANHQDFNLKGKEVVVTGTSLTDIRVSSVAVG